MYITKNEETLGFFHRFDKLTIEGNRWQVQAVNEFYGDNIIKIALKEYYNKNLPDVKEESTDDGQSEILGDSVVYPYETKTYTVKDAAAAEWSLSDTKLAEIKSKTADSVTVYIKTGKSGNFVLRYGDIEKTIKIESF